MKIKNILNNKIIKYMLSIILVILICYNFIYVITNIITDKNYINVCGLRISIMQDDTMKPKIKKNSLLISVKKNISKIEEDDVISISFNKNLKIRRVSKIVDNENIQFVVKGDNNYFNDTEYISKENYQGKVIINIPVIGILFRIFQSKIITVIVLFFIVYIIYNVKIQKTRRNKSKIIRKNNKVEEK